MDRRTFLKGVSGLSGLPLFPSLGSGSTLDSNTADRHPGSQDKITEPVGPGRISVIGCGGCGVRFVSHLSDRGIPDMHDGWCIEYFGIDSSLSDRRYVNEAVMEPIWLPSRSCLGWPSVARAIAKETPEWRFACREPGVGEFKRNGSLRLSEAHLVIVIAGLGGGFGTGFSQVIAHRARRGGAMTVAIVTLPFSHETQRVPPTGELQRLNRAADAVFAFSHDYAPWAGAATTMPNRMGRCEADISQCVRNLIRAFAVPGLIGFDFQDIRPIIQGGGVSWYGHAVGYDRGASRSKLAAEAVINAVSTRKYYPGFIDESYCAATGYGIPNAKSALIVFSGNSETLKLRTIRQGMIEAYSLFGHEATVSNAHVDNTMKTGRIKAEIWLSKIERV